jgi:NTP pyrophosphatase (non-canonical NTP hydrolase)
VSITIKELARAVHINSVDHGWWDGADIEDPREIAAKLALIHSEVSEALEDLREEEMVSSSYRNTDSKPCGFPSELADIVIRALDLAEALNIDLEFEILKKHEYNKSRPYRHGGKAL